MTWIKTQYGEHYYTCDKPEGKPGEGIVEKMNKLFIKTSYQLLTVDRLNAFLNDHLKNRKNGKKKNKLNNLHWW